MQTKIFKKNPYRRSINRLRKVEEILARYDLALKQHGHINTGQLEQAIKEAISTMDYQEVKPYIITMWCNEVYQEVCKEYAKAYPCIEFHEILGR